MADYKITRYVKEEYFVEANTREEAIEICNSNSPGPDAVYVTKETAVKLKEQSDD